MDRPDDTPEAPAPIETATETSALPSSSSSEAIQAASRREPPAGIQHAARKRDRESALGSGAVTPSGSDDSRGFGLTPVAKKGRVQPKSTSPTASRTPLIEETTSAELNEGIIDASPSPPDTPPVSTTDLPGSTPSLAPPETSRVHDIRQKVQRMSTGEGGADEADDVASVASSSQAIVPDDTDDRPSRPVSLVGDDADMASVRGHSPVPEEPPAAASAAEAAAVTASAASSSATPSTPASSKPPSSFASFSKSASPFASVPGSSKPSFGGPAARASLGKVLPLSKPNLSALAHATGGAALDPPSPASSVRAETGSAPPTSRQNSFVGSVRADSLAPEPASTPRAASPLAAAPPSVPDTPAPTAAPPPTPASGGLPTTTTAAPSPSAFAARFTGVNSGFGKAKSPLATSTTTSTSGPSAFGSFSAAVSPFGSVRTAPYPAAGRRPSREGAREPKEASGESGGVGTSPTSEGKRAFGELLREGGAKEDAPVEGEPKQLFKEQEVVTGEEDEELLYSVRGKLYVMEDGQWRERGTGQLRVNSKFGGNAPRLVMRAEATHRLLLNAALFAGFTIKSSDRMVSFATFNEGKLASYALRTSNAATSTATAKAIEAAVSTIKATSTEPEDDEAAEESEV